MKVIKLKNVLKNIFHIIKLKKLLYYIILNYIINISKAEISKIILTIKGKGNQKILDDSISGCSHNINYPDYIYVNNIYQGNSSSIVYNLTKKINNITISWDRQITDCRCMFSYLSNITYIDLSFFNTSKVFHMRKMFYGCSSLISLNLSNFDTSKTTYYNSDMFNKCNSKLIICINEAITHGDILSQISEGNFTKYYCNYNKIIELFKNGFALNKNNITKDDMENNIREEIMNGNLNELIYELINNETEYLMFENNNIKYEITTTDNYNEYKNISIIKLGKCNNLLKNHYNISLNETLIIFKLDIY